MSVKMMATVPLQDARPSSLGGAAGAFMALAVAISAIPAASDAATFTVGGVDYDVTTINGSFDENRTLLEDQVWWGDRDRAFEFSDAVEDFFGFEYESAYYGKGPAFAVSFRDLDLGESLFISHVSYDNHRGRHFSSESFILPSEPGRYAIATPISAIPLPAGGLLLLSGLAGIVGFKRRRKRPV